MGIENTIKNMEEALEKKKAVMRQKSVGKIVKLKERMKTKNDKLERITKERDALKTEIEALEVDQPVEGTETKTETFVPGKDAKPAGDQAGKSTSKITPKKK